jgi:hypothetical protein
MVKTTKMPLEEVRKLLEAGIKLRIIGEESGYPESVISIMGRAWGFAPRKRGRRKAAQ